MCSILQKYIESIEAKAENQEDLFKQLKEENEKKPITVEDNIVKISSVCFVFSCPGKQEMLNNKVCFGQTGENLNILLEELHDLCPKLFQQTDRYKYTIINATNIVHYKALDNKSEADLVEIKEQKGSGRIDCEIKQLSKLQYVILCGKKAEKIKGLFEDNQLKIIHIRHLGLQSINGIQIDKERFTTSTERNKERLRSVANCILQQIEK